MTSGSGNTARPPAPTSTGALRRSPRARLTGLLALLVLTLTLVSPGAAFAASYTDVVDLTFPTDPGVTFIDDYDNGRSGGRVHKATDLMGEKLMPIYAAVGGEVTWAPGADGEGEPSYGFMLTIAGTDGREYNYVHLNNDTPGTDDGSGGPEHAFAAGIGRGAVVERGQLIGWMGDSGNAEGTAPHLHFSIVDPDVSDPYGTNYVNPYFTLIDASERGDFAGGVGTREPDDDASRDRDATPAPTPERTEAPTPEPTATATPEPTEAATPEPTEAASEDAPLVDEEEVAPPAGPEPIDTGVAGPAAERVAGTDRVGTSVALAAAGWDSSKHAVITSAYAFSDGVVAGPLAAALDGPLLTTAPDELDPRVAAQLVDLDVASVTIVGGEMAVSPAVEDAIADAGIAVERLSGEWEVDTAVAVAERVWELRGVPEGERRALVALGRHRDPVKAWPDALAAGWHGAVSGEPVLLVRTDEATASTLGALDGVAGVALVGGEAAIPAAVEDEIAATGTAVRRLAGEDRFATAVAVADDLGDRSRAVLWTATGYDFADALSAAPAIARSGETFLLVDGAAGGADGRIDGFLDANEAAVEQLRVLGGEAAVQDEAVAELQERLGS